MAQVFWATLIVILAGNVTSTGSAIASGIALREGNADWMANAFAGATAKAYDSGTVFMNPAGMTRLDRNEIGLSLNLIAPNVRFRGSNILNPGASTSGSQDGNPAEKIVAPGVFGVWNFSPDLKFGVALTAPFGARVGYRSDFAGRFHSLVSSVSGIQVTTAAGYRINRKLSIGGGPVLDVLSTRLTQAINLGPLNTAFGDPVAGFNGSSAAFGFVIGALYEASDTFRLGISYRSPIRHGVMGMQSISVPPALATGSPARAQSLVAGNGPASISVTMPDSISLGIYYEIDERWAVMMDAQWTHWSVVDTLAIVPSAGRAPLILRENWRNTWFGAVGVNFRPIERLLVQAGVGYDLSPVTDQNRTARVPDANRFLIGLGGTYRLWPGVDLQAAVLQVFGEQARINHAASTSSGVLRGSYDAWATVVSLGLALRF
ncbi:MAG: OmpP1/FadL family transporter [Acetobacteraceae bacterium]